ncbi:mitogen-activated protein kinase kinase kinase kinase [Striga asiatica]|uniref:Mitogen-activated protein kinase kinase kinase kinase n=1 Tax=Striga asiatica TaxID=4170 RepID=A0A5A7QR09_STRAF|nr:mitogen-activated protein kinase kinase kinase kinase [Striga asiatica]
MEELKMWSTNKFYVQDMTIMMKVSHKYKVHVWGEYKVVGGRWWICMKWCPGGIPTDMWGALDLFLLLQIRQSFIDQQQQIHPQYQDQQVKKANPTSSQLGSIFEAQFKPMQ